MSGVKPLAVPADIIYTYDGSFDGFLCCVFESVYDRYTAAGYPARRRRPSPRSWRCDSSLQTP